MNMLAKDLGVALGLGLLALVMLLVVQQDGAVLVWLPVAMAAVSFGANSLRHRGKSRPKE